MKRKKLDHLFVRPDEIRAYMQSPLGLVEQHAYAIFKARGSADGHDLDDWLQAESEVLRPVTAEASDAGEAFVVVATVGDYRPEDLRVSVEPRCLTICGLSAGEDNGVGSSEDESRVGSFWLSFRLPAEVDTSAASAELRRDVLEMYLPKVPSQNDA
jgi:HSP20 family molecular chaperone IbpA